MTMTSGSRSSSSSSSSKTKVSAQLLVALFLFTSQQVSLCFVGCSSTISFNGKQSQPAFLWRTSTTTTSTTTSISYVRTQSFQEENGGVVTGLQSSSSSSLLSPLSSSLPSSSSLSRRRSRTRTTSRRSTNKRGGVTTTTSSSFTISPLFMSSFAADGSEYSSKDSEFESDDEDGISNKKADYSNKGYQDDNDEDDTPTVELQPVPMSKNSGNRFVAFLWDRLLDTENRDVLDLHYDRTSLTEDHVMFCRKQNLYNETFNTESMVDILWSRQLLSSDLKRTVGGAMCMESTELNHVYDVMGKEPIIKMLTGGDIKKIPLYRWRHIRDYTLRQDDGRFGCPAMLLALDHEAEVGGENTNAIRQQTQTDMLEYLIRSERVTAAGPLHLLTEYKDDASSIPVGDLIIYNAKHREEAIEFAENLPNAQRGVYDTMRVHFFNNLDVTGKFVSEDPLRDAPCGQMKEALEYWGYPVEDEQTPWLNW